MSKVMRKNTWHKFHYVSYMFYYYLRLTEGVEVGDHMSRCCFFHFHSKAIRVLLSKGLTPNKEKTLRLISEKHANGQPPTAPETTLAPQQLPASFKFRETLRSSPKETACGPSGSRVEHLIEATEATLPVSLESTLQSLINHLIAEKRPQK